MHYTTLVIDSADQDWIQKLSDFMDKFYRCVLKLHVHTTVGCFLACLSCERRSEVRKAALAYLGKVLDDHWLTQEGPLLQHILLPYFKPLPLDTDSDLRCQAVQLLVYLLPSSSTGHTLSLLALLSQVGLMPAMYHVITGGVLPGVEERLTRSRTVRSQTP